MLRAWGAGIWRALARVEWVGQDLTMSVLLIPGPALCVGISAEMMGWGLGRCPGWGYDGAWETSQSPGLV